MAKKNQPSATSDGYDCMSDTWSMVDDLLGGTRAMRDAAETYLPRHEGETQRQYFERLNVNTLYNMFEETLGSLTGRVFAGPVQLSDDVPEVLQELAENMDGQGTDITIFARRWFRTGLAKAFAHVLVDFPSLPKAEDGTEMTRTAADEIGLRPYAKVLTPECVLFLGTEIIDGVEVCTEARILETVVERDGWLEVCIPQIRVLRPGSWQLFRLVEKKKDTWQLTDEGTTSLDRVPLVTFYAGERCGPQEAKPPLIDLAYLNVAHWQSTSDQRVATTVARFPMLAGAGTAAPGATPEEDPNGSPTVGPKQFMETSKPDAKFYFVEHTGKALESGRNDLQDLEQQMAAYGAEFLRKKPGSTTATERALDSAENSSDLEAMALVFRDSLENVMQLMAEWMKLDDGGSVVLQTDFTEAPSNEAPALDTLNKARAQRDLTRKTYLSELKRRNILSDEVDIEAEDSAAQDETNLEMENERAALDAEATARAAQAGNNPGAGNGE